MNLAVRRFFLFFFSLATLSACEDPTDIGINLQDDFQIGTDYTDTLTINTGTVLLTDSIVSFRQTPALVGFMADPYLGTVRATHFTEVGLGGANLKFGDAPVADSLVLTLDYNFLYPRKANTLPMTLNVYELTESFQEKSSYFTNSPALSYASTPVGSATFTPVIERMKLKNGTLVDSARLVRIKLSSQLAQRIIEQSGKAPLASHANFVNFFKGFAFVAEGNAPSTIMGINTSPNTVVTSNQTALTLYYKEGAEGETKSHSFSLNGTRVRNFTKLIADRSGTAISDLQEKYQFIPSEDTDGESYVQSGTQLLTKITIPHLKKLKELHGEFVINRAELIVPVKSGTIEFDDTVFHRFTPPMRLAMFETNNSNRILKTSDGTPRSVQVDLSTSLNSFNYPTALTYNPRKEHYAVNITSYVQSILMDKKPNDGILLAPANINPSESGNQITQDVRPLRAILTNTDARRVKLRIYFSKLN